MLTLPSTPLLGKDDVYVLRTADGSDTLYSKALQVSYHSIYGAVSESRHVFIEHGLSTQLSHDPIHILEFGIGTGLNAFLAYLFSEKQSHRVRYSGIEPKPLALNIVKTLNYPEYLAASHAQHVFLDMHEKDRFSNGKFEFRRFLSIEEITIDPVYHCIFFDAFSPSEQEDAWTEKVFSHLYECAVSGACLITYCVQGQVRRTLHGLGNC